VGALPEEDISEGVGAARCKDVRGLRRVYSSSFSWSGSSLAPQEKYAHLQNRGVYVWKKSKNRLLKDCEKSDPTIEGKNAVLQGRRKRQNAYIEVV
jgi:hypothetical protein